LLPTKSRPFPKRDRSAEKSAARANGSRRISRPRFFPGACSRYFPNADFIQGGPFFSGLELFRKKTGGATKTELLRQLRAREMASQARPVRTTFLACTVPGLPKTTRAPPRQGHAHRRPMPDEPSARIVDVVREKSLVKESGRSAAFIGSPVPEVQVHGTITMALNARKLKWKGDSCGRGSAGKGVGPVASPADVFYGCSRLTGDCEFHIGPTLPNS